MAVSVVGPARPEDPGAPGGAALADAGAGAVAGLGRSAGLIAALTTVARVVGFARIFVFTALIGFPPLANTYHTVNTLPNILFEVVAGGALALVVVPLLSGALARGDAASVNRTSSALVTWAVVLLTPVAVLVAVFARPIVEAVVEGPGQIAVGTRMLYVFAPQIVLYGVGIVLTGVLQAHRRFTGPALAPLLSSLVVMTAYAAFALVAPSGTLALRHELVLSLGTTAAVAVLSLSLLVPLRATGVRLRPTVRFPPGVARRLRGLVGGGVAAIVAQQLALLVAIWLCKPVAGFQAYGLAQAMYLLPWAVLAVPVATSAFPRLAAAHAAGDAAAYQAVLVSSARTVLVLSATGAAALIAVATPAADLIVAVAGSDGSTVRAAELAGAIAAFGPGLLGYGLLALLSRALYAADAGRAAAIATVSGWCVVIAASIALVAAVPDRHLLAALAAGNTIGMTVLGVVLTVLVHRRAGALPGLSRAAVAATAVLATAGAAGWAAQAGVRAAGLGPGIPGSLAQGILVAVAVVLVSAGVAATAYPRHARAAASRLKRNRW